MATKKKAARKSAPPRKQSAAELHELARVQRRSGDAAAAHQTLERARQAEREEQSR